jgi:hypothetical protein
MSNTFGADTAEDVTDWGQEKVEEKKRANRPADEFAWLIEGPGPHYLCVSKSSTDHLFTWSKDHDKALRFWTCQQADDAMMALRRIEPALFKSPYPQEPRPVEHGWTRTRSETAI